MSASERVAAGVASDEDVARSYVAELREIAGMLAQSPDGPLRWKQYRVTAIADYLAALTRAIEASK